MVLEVPTVTSQNYLTSASLDYLKGLGYQIGDESNDLLIVIEGGAIDFKKSVRIALAQVSPIDFVSL